MSKSDFSQFMHDQLNNRVDLLEEGLRVLCTHHYDINHSGQVRYYVTCLMWLTWGKLFQQDDWVEWQNLEYLQLNQYNAQGIFGEPVLVNKAEAFFYLVWTYGIKTLDRQKKARCVCNVSSCSGLVKVLDETTTNCIDQKTLISSMRSQPEKTSLLLAQTYLMPLLKPPCLSKVSVSISIRHSTTGGSTTSIDLPFHLTMWFLPYP